MSFEYIDIHAHVNFAAYDSDRTEVCERAKQEKIAMINVGTQVDTSQAALALADEYEHVFAIVGIHPIHTTASYHDTNELGEGSKEFISRGEAFDDDLYRALAAHPKCVGFGETGLDYYRKESGSVVLQREVFTRHIELAIEMNKPLMLHVRASEGSTDAYHDALEILESYQRKHGERVRGDFHFFAGDIEVAERALAAGFRLSFTGVVTFARDYDEVVRYVPSDMIMAETDCPYVTPKPYRGKRNEPYYVTEVYRALAEIRGDDFDMLRCAINQNAAKLWGLDTFTGV